jgi:hypothetical protein
VQILIRTGTRGASPAGENARIIQSRITRDKANIVNPVCIVDHAYGYKGNTFNGLPVYTGLDAVKECIDKYDIKCAIIVNSNMPDDFIDGVRTICKDKGVELRDFVLGTEYRSLDVRLRELLSKTNGKVCVIEKGVEDRHYEDVKAALLAKIPEQKLGEAQDIANVVAFLASDEAQYITGQTIHVNGGMAMI